MTYDEWYQQNYADSPVSHADYTFGEEVSRWTIRNLLSMLRQTNGSEPMNQPPTSAAMRAAQEWFCSPIGRTLSCTIPLEKAEKQLAAIIAKHLPVSEQGSDSYKGIPRCIGCGRLLSPHCEDCQPHPATTPPPASDGRCVRCGCGKVASNASLSELLTDCECDCHRGVESSTLPTPSVRGRDLATPPTTDTVLVSREDAAKIAEKHRKCGKSNCSGAIAAKIRALPPYTKE